MKQRSGSAPPSQCSLGALEVVSHWVLSQLSVEHEEKKKNKIHNTQAGGNMPPMKNKCV